MFYGWSDRFWARNWAIRTAGTSHTGLCGQSDTPFGSGLFARFARQAENVHLWQPRRMLGWARFPSIMAIFHTKIAFYPTLEQTTR